MTEDPPPHTRHTFSMGRKFSALMSCVIALTCGSLSWYLLEQHTASRVQALHNQGNLLTESLARLGRYGVFSQDQIRLNELIESTFPANEVVYIVFSDLQGQILASRTKGQLLDQDSFTRTLSEPLLPSPIIARTSLQTQNSHPTITPVKFVHGRQKVLPTNHGKVGTIETTFFTQNTETVFDFALPILRKPLSQALDSETPLSLDGNTDLKSASLSTPPQVYGLVQIGLSDVYLQQELRAIILQVIILTTGIILLGILVSFLMATHITSPLQALTATARRIMKGDLSAHLPSTTEDEIGELNDTFNRMTRVLQERNRTTAKHLDQLKTLSHSGTLVSSPIEVAAVFSSVVEVLTSQLGFTRALAGLYDVETQHVSTVHTRGFSEDLSHALQYPELVVSDDQYLVAGLLCQAHLSLHPHIAPNTWHLDYPLLQTASTFPIGSSTNTSVPSKTKVLAFIAADRGPIQCEPFDTDLIRTLGNHLTIAIDKIFAYKKLEQLNQSLESRVCDRTDALETANSKLKDLDRLKSTFVSMASHELRTPLTSIKMFVDNMAQGVGGPLSQGHTEYLTRIRANVDRLQRMIAELLDLTQIESGRMKLSFMTISLQDVIKESVDSLLPFSSEKDVAIRIKASDSLPRIEADHDKLFQILTNLLHNAVKFSPAGNQVEVHVQSINDEHIEVCVEDKGCGMAPKELDKIFQPFYRSPTAVSQTSGAGLGLALCQHLVALHQGKLWAESHPGQGSRFHLALPIKHVPLPHSVSQQVFR